jgi:hypothetical protein
MARGRVRNGPALFVHYKWLSLILGSASKFNIGEWKSELRGDGILPVSLIKLNLFYIDVENNRSDLGINLLFDIQRQIF